MIFAYELSSQYHKEIINDLILVAEVTNFHVSLNPLPAPL